jgi:hypothetical protein
LHERVQIVGYDIENLVELSQRFGETTKADIGIRVLSEQRNITRVEPLSFVEIRLTAVPLIPSAFEVSKRLRNSAAVWQRVTRLLEVTRSSVVILQAGIAIVTHRHESLAEVRLKGQRGFGCLPCFFAKRARWLQS